MKRGSERGELGRVHLVVNVGRLAARDAVERALGERRFDAHDGLRPFCRGRLRIPEEPEHALHMRHVLLTKPDRFGILLQIVITIRQTEPTLVGLRDILAGVFEVRTRAELERRVYPDAMEPRDLSGQTGEVTDGGDPIQLLLGRRDYFRVDGLFVHAGSVIVADLLLDGATFRVVARGLLQNVAQDFAIALLPLVEPPPG